MDDGGGTDWKARLKEMGLGRKRAPRRSRAAGAPAGDSPVRRNPTASGRAGEAAAARWLEERGFRILARNARFPGGEIDLVALDGPVLVFVEVKRRRSAARGDGAEAVTPVKRTRILRAARQWLAANPADGTRPVRFDVVALRDEPFEVEWIKGAFDAS